MGFEGTPDDVKKKILSGDHDTLSAMGKKGARAAADTRAERKILRKTRALEDRLDAARRGSLSNEGDVLPPDDALIASLEASLDELRRGE
jgi:hypothetical protein